MGCASDVEGHAVVQDTPPAQAGFASEISASHGPNASHHVHPKFRGAPKILMYSILLMTIA